MKGIPGNITHEISEVFKKFPKIDKAILYGSRAKGNAKESSDIDIVIIGDSLFFSDLLNIETQLDGLDFPYYIDLSLYHLIQNEELLDHIKRVGNVVYSRVADLA